MGCNAVNTSFFTSLRCGLAGLCLGNYQNLRLFLTSYNVADCEICISNVGKMCNLIGNYNSINKGSLITTQAMVF